MLSMSDAPRVRLASKSSSWLGEVQNEIGKRHLTLLCCSGYQASQPACHTAAAVTVQALYLVLSKDAEQCKHLAVGTHILSSGYVKDMKQGLHTAIQALGDCLPTQLIAVACLARLCTQVAHTQKCFC